MAAYAALISLMNNIEQIKCNPHLSTCFHKKQMESLGEKVHFLVGFLEHYNSHGGSQEAEDLESRIASAAHEAEDAIESHVVHQILAASSDKQSISFLLDLQQILQGMKSFEEQVIKLKKERGCWKPASSSRPLSTGKNTMVGFDEYLSELLDMLTHQQSARKIISIIGMGGIGKTTLARNAYDNLLVAQLFDIHAWVTVSQGYSVGKILSEALSCLNEWTSGSDVITEAQLGEKMYKTLCGRRYLLILDDLWDTDIWDKIKFYFPCFENRSRIIVTTRVSDVAHKLGSQKLVMNLLDDDKSWSLFSNKAFGQESCPPELQEIGKDIVKRCRGLPLSIAVMGGLLGNSSRTPEYWGSVARDTNSVLMSEKDEHCLNILSLSYNHLPAHLKPCFLYLGIYPEDYTIRVSRLIKLVVAEGFLNPNESQSLEEIAEGYIEDLADRNLISVRRWRWNGTMKYFVIHDLVRELCLRIAEKEKFLYISTVQDIERGIAKEHRRVVFHGKGEHASPLASSGARTFISNGGSSLPFELSFLRVLKVNSDCLDAVFQQLNLRCLLYQPLKPSKPELPPSISLLWNLQTLIVRGESEQIVAPSEIWSMRQLRHVDCNEVRFPDPPPTGAVLQNLQTLANILNLAFSDEVCKRIPNIKKMHVRYHECRTDHYCLDGLRSLHKLESLNCLFYQQPEMGCLLKNLRFPSSLQKLTLANSCLSWNDVTEIGLLLPLLKVLKLAENSVVGPVWDVVEGAFPCLKFLRIDCEDLIHWNADNFHFPVLEKLVLCGLVKLDEVPLGMAEVATLRYLRLYLCSVSTAISSTKILDEKTYLGHDDLEVRIKFEDNKDEEMFKEGVEMLESYTSKNLQYTTTSYFLDFNVGTTILRLFHP